MKKLFKTSKRSAIVSTMPSGFEQDDPLYNNVYFLVKGQEGGILYDAVSNTRLKFGNDQNTWATPSAFGLNNDYSVNVLAGAGKPGFVNVRPTIPLTGDFCFDTWLLLPYDAESVSRTIFAASITQIPYFIWTTTIYQTYLSFNSGTQLSDASLKSTNFLTLKHLAVDRRDGNIRTFFDGALRNNTVYRDPLFTTNSGYFQLGSKNSDANYSLRGHLYLPRLTLASRYNSNFNPLDNKYGLTEFQG